MLANIRDPNFRGRLSSVLETEQGKALRKRESRVGERYKGGRRSQIEKGPIDLQTGSVVAPVVSPGRIEEGFNSGNTEASALVSEKRFIEETPLDCQQDSAIDAERRKTDPKKHVSSWVSHGDVLSNKNRMAEFLRENNQTSKLDQFEAQFAQDSEGYSDDEADRTVEEAEAKVLARVTELENRQREAQKRKESTGSIVQSEGNSIEEREEDEKGTLPSRRSLDSLSKSVGSAGSRKKTGSSIGSSLKYKMSKYVPGTPKGKYRNRRSYEEKSESIATSNDELKHKHLLECGYYFQKNPLEL